MSETSVKILRPGMVKLSGDSQSCIAEATISLVEGEKNILVDTGDADDKEFLIKTLKKENLEVDDIDIVVVTHNHPDHNANRDIFPNARIYGGDSFYWRRNPKLYEFYPSDFFEGKLIELDKNTHIINTPGHSSSNFDVSVLTKTKKGVYGLVGDLFWSENDYKTNTEYVALVDDKNKQNKSRQKMKGLADYIVPGHGDVFKIKKI